MSKGRENPTIYMALVLFLSALAHLLLLFIAPYLLPETPDTKERLFKSWKDVPEKKIEEKKRAFQVVSLVPFEKTPRPDEAKYRAEFDQKVDKEKKAPEAPTSKGMAKPSQVPQKARLMAGRGKKLPNDPLGIRPTFAQNSHSENNYLPDVPDGDNTELNAWQWKHAPFFNRIRERIKSLWSPQSQIDRYDPQGELLGQINRVTVVSVTLNTRGEISEIFVKEESGVAYLDAEAVRAFKEASPFIYPPKELFNKQGEFSFTFAFHLEINRGFSLNFDWDK